MSTIFQNISILAPAGQENRDKHGYLALKGARNVRFYRIRDHYHL